MNEDPDRKSVRFSMTEATPAKLPNDRERVNSDDVSVVSSVDSPARSLSSGNRPKSFIDLDVLKNKDTWHEIRPNSKRRKRAGSIKGTQSFSRFNREFYFPQNGADEFEKMFFSWVLVTILAIVVALAGLAIEMGVKVTSWAVYGASQKAIIDHTSNDPTDGEVTGAFFSFACCAAFFATLASMMVVYISPLSEGSGIPAVKSYLNGVHLTGLFSFPTMLCKSVGCAFAIGSGLVAGREGPIIHVGAILGAAMSQGSSQWFKMRLTGRLNKHFRSAEWKRDFAVMGSACGVAAAFGAPMGGVLFAIEEGATVWRQQLTFLSMYAACLTAFLASTFKVWVESPGTIPPIPEVLFGSFRAESPHIQFTTADAPYVILIGVIGGAVGTFYAFAQTYLIAFRKKYVRTSRVYTILEVILVSMLVSSCRFWIPKIWGKCIDDHVFEEALGHHSVYDGVPVPDPFYCGDHQVNDLGTLFWVPMDKFLKFMLHSPEYDAISVPHLFASLIFYLFGAILVFGTAIPSGLFIPAFAIGASFGRLVGLMHASITGSNLLITSFTFLGCAASLGGMTRVTISVAMIALESTQNFNASLYCFIAVIIAKLVADSMNLGIYDVVIESKEIPFLVDDLGYEGYQISTEDIMVPVKDPYSEKETIEIDDGITLEVGDNKSRNANSDGMGSIKSLDSVQNMINLMKDNPTQHEFLVIDEMGGLEGTIERLIILRLLEARNFGENPALLHPSAIDSAWPNLRNASSEAGEKMIADRMAKESYLDMIIDLRPYVDCDPAIVLSTGSMRKAHAHIRNGERTVLVANPSSVHIIGAVKRQDIMPGFLEATLHAKKKAYARERSKSAAEKGGDNGLNDDHDEDEDSDYLEQYDPEKATAAAAQKDEVVDSSQEQYNLNPFEPRFYELLYHWLEYNEWVGNHHHHNKPMTAFAAATIGGSGGGGSGNGSKSPSGKARRAEGRYEMVSKAKNFSEVVTLSGR